MILALIILSGLIILETAVIYGLLNRLLIQAKVAPLLPVAPAKEETPLPLPVKKRFSVAVSE